MALLDMEAMQPLANTYALKYAHTSYRNPSGKQRG